METHGGFAMGVGTMSCLAMAGMAEAVAAEGVGIVWGSLLFAGVLLVVSLKRKSVLWWSGAAFPLLVVGLLCQPWQCFAPLSAEEMRDLDVVEWTRTFRETAGAWMVVSIAVLATGAFFPWRRRVARKETANLSLD